MKVEPHHILLALAALMMTIGALAGGSGKPTPRYQPIGADADPGFLAADPYYGPAFKQPAPTRRPHD